eukprot:GGOE01030153.1.p1 GENE.GGOE01030153.1~~GGOE01030153.1.p1  ORF type:complete len:970 (-),score=281.25 GGOE01030153.1:118-2670(-)
MNEVVDTFAGLMGTVVTDFKLLASNYTSQIRADLAAKVIALLASAINAGAKSRVRLQQLIDIGLLDITRAPTDPIGEKDCDFLSVLCNTAYEVGPYILNVVSATGRLYSCGLLDGGLVSVVSRQGGLYNQSNLRWRPYAVGVPAAVQKSMKDRCLSEPSEVEVVGRNCVWPMSCQCGADPRCTYVYQFYVNTSASHQVSFVRPEDSGVVQLTVALNFVNASATPPALLGVSYGSNSVAMLNLGLSYLLGPLGDTNLAVLMDDAVLSVLGNMVRPCAPNDVTPGNLSFPAWSAFRSCDPGLRTVAQYISDHRPITKPFTLESDGFVWDVKYDSNLQMSCYFVVGANKSLINKDIVASEARATTQLNAVRTELTRKVAASGAATNAYVAAVGEQNVQATQAMQNSFLLELHQLENSSRASLAASQQSSAANAESTTHSQATAVEQLKSDQLSEMATTVGWTIAVVLAILLLSLLISMCGTIRITNSLANIIGLMEDVADMKVENLTVPQSSGVREVARIQAAFQVMVERLSEYKSYIPAGVFEKLGETAKEVDLNDDRRTSGHSTSLASPIGRLVHSRKQSSIPSSGPAWKSTNSVAVLSINVVGFMNASLDLIDCQSKSVFNEYVVHVHEVVSQGRGNIDFLAGDQIFVTFNAHLPCSDPAGVATAAALDVRQSLLSKLGDQLKFQIGMAFGPVFASSVGYAKFKFMVTVGTPMKVAAILAHMKRLVNGAILVDAGLKERVKYEYHLRPVELLYLPRLKSFAADAPTSQRVSMLVSKKNLQADEWLYQVGKDVDYTEWSPTFDRLVAATSEEERQRRLQQYLADFPDDDVAQRLMDRLPLWVPGCGIPLES